MRFVAPALFYVWMWIGLVCSQLEHDPIRLDRIMLYLFFSRIFRASR